LSLLTKCSNITVDHREANPSCLVRGRRCFSTGGPAFTLCCLSYSYNTIQCMVLSILFHTKMDILHGSDLLSRIGGSGAL
jgi:hypothetical protein